MALSGTTTPAGVRKLSNASNSSVVSSARRSSSAGSAERTKSRTTSSICCVLVLIALSPVALIAYNHHRNANRTAELPEPLRDQDAADDPSNDLSKAAAARGNGFLPMKDVLSWQALTEVPRNDARSYELATLQNGLQVLSIQDNRSLSVGFALAVKAGSFSDPPDLPGLMHFCEHMLFLGTEKYPDPEGFDEFVNMHGGSQNAYTAAEVTNYHVQLSASAEEEGMDRFAQFFKAPLFSPQFARKEVHAIDSEHAKNVQSSGNRVYAVMMSLADPRSPASRFHTGNVDTLPTESGPKGNHTFQMLRQNFEDLYCPSRMRLVTFGPRSPGEQLQLATKTFGTIPPGSESCRSSPPQSYADPPAWPFERMGRWVDIKGTTPHGILWLQFPLPDLSSAYPSQPLDYIVWALSYQGTGSFFEVLRDVTNLAYTVSAGSDDNSAASLVTVAFGLTEHGRKRPDLVLEIFFAYMAILRKEGIKMDLQESLEKSSATSWDWAEPAAAASVVSDLAERLTRVKPADVLWADSLTRRRDVKLTKHILELLQPSNMNAAFVDPREVTDSTRFSLGRQEAVEKVLPYYGVKYSVRTTSEVIPGAATRWNAWLDKDTQRDTVISELAAELLKGGVSLPPGVAPVTPPPLKDLARKLDLKHAHAELFKTTIDEELFGKPPRSTSIASDKPASSIGDSQEFWFREGWTSNAPKNSPLASIQVSFRALMPEGAPEVPALDHIRTGLYSRSLGEEIDPMLEDLSNEGASYSVEIGPQGMSLTFSGFPPVLQEMVPRVLTAFDEHMSLPSLSVRLGRLVQQIEEDLQSFSDMPIQYALNHRSIILTKGAYARDEQLAALETVNGKAVSNAFSDVLLPKRLHTTAMAMGNLDQSEAMRFMQQIAHHFKRPADIQVASAEGSVERVTPVVNPAHSVELREMNPRPNDPNHVIVVSIFHGVATIPGRVVLGLLGQVLGELAFFVLRTTLELGYVANGGDTSISNIQLISAVVQGNKENADAMEAAVHRLFLVDMLAKLEQMDDDKFNAYKAAFADALVQKPFHTGDEVGHLWGPITSGSHCFDMRDKMMKYLNEQVKSKATLLAAWKKLMMPESGTRKRVVVKMFPGEVPPRPSMEELKKMWDHHNIPGNMQELLRREHEESILLDKANSATRKQLLSDGRYFPTTLKCDLTDDDFSSLIDTSSLANASATSFTEMSESSLHQAADLGERKVPIGTWASPIRRV